MWSCVCPLVVLMVGAGLFHGSSALKCYQCLHEDCKQSLKNDHVEKKECRTGEICGKLVAETVKLGKNWTEGTSAHTLGWDAMGTQAWWKIMAAYTAGWMA